MKYLKWSPLLLCLSFAINASLIPEGPKVLTPEEGAKNFNIAASSIEKLSKELLETENTYRGSLKKMVALQRLSKEKNPGILKGLFRDRLDSEIMRVILLSNSSKVLYDLIVQLHELVDNSVSEISKNYKVDIDKNSNQALVENLTKINNFFADDSAFLTPYVNFIKNSKSLQNDTFFPVPDTGEEEIIKASSLNKDMASLRIMPIQRGPRYMLLFRELSSKLKDASLVEVPCGDIYCHHISIETFRSLDSVKEAVDSILKTLRQKIEKINNAIPKT